MADRSIVEGCRYQLVHHGAKFQKVNFTISIDIDFLYDALPNFVLYLIRVFRANKHILNLFDGYIPVSIFVEDSESAC